jgi:hypothetical protein
MSTECLQKQLTIMIISVGDNGGKYLINKQFDYLLSSHGVTYKIDISYHPQTNGQEILCTLDKAIPGQAQVWMVRPICDEKGVPIGAVDIENSESEISRLMISIQALPGCPFVK